MRDYLPFVVVGITTGSVYALAAVGLVLTFKTSGIFNFGHGALAATAAYVFHVFRSEQSLAWPLALVVTLVIVGLGGGLMLERMGYLLTGASAAAKTAATVGLLVGLQQLLVAVFGSATKTMPFFLPTGLFSVAGTNVRYEQLIVVVLVAVLVSALYLLLNRTRVGVAMQAVVDDPELVGLQGIDPTSVRRHAWMVGSCFASLSGILLAPTIGLDAGILTLLVFFAFGAAAVGRFTSLPLTYAGGMAIGIGAEVIKKVIDGSSTFAQLPSTLPFLVLFVVLLVTPTRHLVERHGARPRAPMPPQRFSRATTRVVAVVGVPAALVLPHLVGTRVTLWTTGLVFVILFASLGLLVRTSGQISLAHMALAAVGSATMARCLGAGVPFPLAVLTGGLVAAPVGAMVAIPAIRLSGVYLAIATFGFGLLAQRLLFGTILMFGGETNSLSAARPALFGLDSDVGYYYVVLAFAVAACVGVVVIRRSRLGRMLRALSDSPRALDAHGANTNLTRLLVFVLSSFLAGIAGGLYGPITGTASSANFDFSVSLVLVAVLVITGRQPILSPVIAAFLVAVLPFYTENEFVLDYTNVAFGAGALIAAMFGGRPLLARLRDAGRTRDRQRSRAQREARHDLGDAQTAVSA